MYHGFEVFLVVVWGSGCLSGLEAVEGCKLRNVLERRRRCIRFLSDAT